MSFTPGKAKKDGRGPSSIEGLAFRTIGAAMSTTPSMSVSVNNKDGGGSSYVSMLGYLSESLPGPRWSWDEGPEDGEAEEESPYENIESLERRRRSLLVARYNATEGQRHSAEGQRPNVEGRKNSVVGRRHNVEGHRHSAEGDIGAYNRISRPPVYENISDFIRSSEIELKYTSYDTPARSLYHNKQPSEPMYDSTPCLAQPSEPLYDSTSLNTLSVPPLSNTNKRISAAALYDSIPCTVHPPPNTPNLEDFHFRPLPVIKDKQGPLKKLFSLPKRFHHKKKPSRLLGERHPSLDALNEVGGGGGQNSSIDMVVSMERGAGSMGMEMHATIKQRSLTRHTSVEVLLNEGIGPPIPTTTPPMAPTAPRPPPPAPIPPPPPKPPRVMDDMVLKSNLKSGPSYKDDANPYDDCKSISDEQKGGTPSGQTLKSFQHELKIVLEQRLSAQFGHSAQFGSSAQLVNSAQFDEPDGLVRRRAASCSSALQSATRGSGPYDKPWDQLRAATHLLPPNATPDSLLLPFNGGLRKRSASMSDVSSQESLCSPKSPVTLEIEDIDSLSSSPNIGSVNMSPDLKEEEREIFSGFKGLTPEKVALAKLQSKSMSNLTPQEELKYVLAQRALKRKNDENAGGNGLKTEVEDHRENLDVVRFRDKENDTLVGTGSKGSKEEKSGESEDDQKVKNKFLDFTQSIESRHAVSCLDLREIEQTRDGDGSGGMHTGTLRPKLGIAGALYAKNNQQAKKTPTEIVERKPMPPVRTTSLRKTEDEKPRYGTAKRMPPSSMVSKVPPLSHASKMPPSGMVYDVPQAGSEYAVPPSGMANEVSMGGLMEYAVPPPGMVRAMPPAGMAYQVQPTGMVYEVPRSYKDQEVDPIYSDVKEEEEQLNNKEEETEEERIDTTVTQGHLDCFYSFPKKQKKKLQSSLSEGNKRDGDNSVEPPLLIPPKPKLSVCHESYREDPENDETPTASVRTRHLPEIVITSDVTSDVVSSQKIMTSSSPDVAGQIYDVPTVQATSDVTPGGYDSPGDEVEVMSDIEGQVQRSNRVSWDTSEVSAQDFCFWFKELLPGIEDYLIRVLKDETLSEAAEKRRQYYSERLEVLRLAFPPTLPPRNDADDHIAQQRELSRLRGPLPPPSEFGDGEEYDPVEDPATVAPRGKTAFIEQDDLYEEPVDLTDHTPSAPISVDDRFSDTSYESYDDEEEAGTLYINQDFHDGHDPSHDPPLPSPDPSSQTECDLNRNKRKKKDKDGIPAKLLPNVSVFGDLYVKGQWSWSKRYCLLADGRLLAFKNENATKPSSEVTLDGYDVIYLEKEAKRSHVMRISRPGCETYFFSAETKDKADQWMEVLTAAACGGSGGSITTSGFNSAASSSPKIDKDADTSVTSGQTDGVRKSSSLTDLSMTSEGSSGDGTIGQPQSSQTLDKRASKTDRKGSKPLLDSLSTFFGTLGKKKGEKVQQQKPRLAEMEEDADPEAVVSGYLSVYSDLMASKKWNRRWCAVKQSILSVHREVGDEPAEFSLPLPGCEVTAHPKHKMALRVLEEGTEKIVLDVQDTMAHGQWLKVLLQETGCADRPQNNQINPSPPDEDIYCDVDEDEDLLKSWNLGPKDISLNSNSKSAISKPSKLDAEEKPPPLPSAPPPGVSVSKYLKNDKSKQQNRAQRRTSIKRPTEAPPSVPVIKRGETRRSDSDEPKEVVKCHLGPTIDEDRDILQTTKNPILVELRKSRTGPPSGGAKPPGSPPLSAPSGISGAWRESDLDRVEADIAQAKKKLAQVKKKRAEIRSKKLTCSDIEEKLRYDDQLRDLLREQDNAEATLAKLSLKQAELQAIARKAKLEADSLARRESLSRVERQGSFSRLDKRDSLSRPDTGEWDIITKKTGTAEDSDSSPRKFSAGSPRSNGSSSPGTGRKANSLDRVGGSPRAATGVSGGSRNGLGGRGSGRTTRYTSDLTGRTTTRTSVTRTSSLSRGVAPGSPKGGLQVTRPDEEDDRSPSPRGGRKQVQEKLKLWENISGTSNC